MNTKSNTIIKSIFKRLISKNYWYDVTLRTTIGKTIKQMTDFNKEEISTIKKTYTNLRKDNSHLIEDIQSEYHVSWCSMILSLYRICLSKGITQAEAMDIVEKIIFTNMDVQSTAKYVEAALDKSKDPFSYIVGSSKNQELNFFGHTFIFEREIDNENSYHLKVKKCLYYDYFKSYNVLELMKIACKYDMVSWTQGIVPEKHKLIFQRPFTIGLDGKDCEFNFDRITKS